jgi:rhodanese-related sulfurtransferase
MIRNVLNMTSRNGSRAKPLRFGLAAAVTLLASALAMPSAFAGPLGLLEQRLRASYPDVQHVAPDVALEEPSAPNEDVLLVDVREAKEFAVSHLPGAVRVDPEASPSEALARIGDVAGRRVLFYCSVGVRSSKLADGMRAALRERGARSVENLSGGIFRWHNEKRPLVRDGAPTDAVHPYNTFWSVLLERRALIAYSPRPVSQDGTADEAADTR